MADGFSVDLGALREARDGINGTLAQASQQQVSDIPFKQSAAGHQRLAGVMSGFLSRWQHGIDNLAADGREIANRLNVTTNTYQATDEGLHHHITSILHGYGPDPGTR
ncbi:MAG TPA: hypothetical protein VLW50_28050 [Streptosporangiaceae bacterium]|nr:hypothetical protein [Streptosporangiaceae bacterium]